MHVARLTSNHNLTNQAQPSHVRSAQRPQVVTAVNVGKCNYLEKRSYGERCHAVSLKNQHSSAESTQQRRTNRATQSQLSCAEPTQQRRANIAAQSQYSSTEPTEQSGGQPRTLARCAFGAKTAFWRQKLWFWRVFGAKTACLAPEERGFMNIAPPL